MKMNFRHIASSLIIALFFLGSCQEEVIEITNPDNSSTINSESPLADLVQKTSMKDGSVDNILDNTSCSTVVLPVTVIANGIEVVINSEEDYKLVERIFDESETDDDELEFIYPIKVILSDHAEVTVNNDDELEDLLKDCVEGGFDDDIECLDFIYPLNISIYDAANQVLDVITITNDEELHDLFESLEDEDFISFNFPLTLLLLDGTVVIVNDNDALEDLIEDEADDCDEDDDNDYNDDDIDDTELKAILIEGEWAITYFFDDIDETASFNGYTFTFFEDESAIAKKDGIETEGHWESYGDDGSLEIELNFGSESPLDELEEDWGVVSFSDTRIELNDHNEDGTADTVVFEKL